MVNRVINERKRYEDLRRTLVDREQLRLPRAVTNAEVESPLAVTPKRSAGAADPLAMSPNPTHGLATFPIDMDRLTDQVVRTIDSRIIAHRERLGRVF
jgi:hypothetical protein